MTDEQKEMFRKSGCVSRCLIKLAKNINPISTEDYCKTFGHLFPNPTTEYGMLDGISFVQIVSQLLHFSNYGFQNTYDETDVEFNKNKRVVLITSQINLNQGHSDIKKHCSILTTLDLHNGFSIWTPSQDGNDSSIDLQIDGWTGKQCSGISMF